MADVIAEHPDLIREEDAAERLSELLARARVEVSKAVIGHDEAVDLMLISALARGHILLVLLLRVARLRQRAVKRRQRLFAR